MRTEAGLRSIEIPEEIQEKLEKLKDLPFYQLKAIRNSVKIPDGTWVLYSVEFGHRELKASQVIRTDKRGIVKTTSGVNFTPNYGREYTSTQKFQGEYYVLYDLDETVTRLAVMQREREVLEKVLKLNSLITKIKSLDPEKDEKTIQYLLDLLEEIECENRK